MLLAIVSWVFMVIKLIYMVVIAVCLYKTKLRAGKCFKCNIIVYGIISFVLSLVFWVLALITFLTFDKKIKVLNKWR
jgi:hypothetical protein